MAHRVGTPALTLAPRRPFAADDYAVPRGMRPGLSYGMGDLPPGWCGTGCCDGPCKDKKKAPRGLARRRRPAHPPAPFIRRPAPPAYGLRRKLRASGVGDWGGAISTMIAHNELEDLMRAVRKLNDSLISAINSRNSVLAGYREAKKLLEDAERLAGPTMLAVPFGPPIPNPATLPALTALAAARDGVRVFARQVQMLGVLDRTFTEISAALTRAGISQDADAVDSTLRQVRRFNVETDNMFWSGVPEYAQAKREILAEAERQMKALGVPTNAPGDPRWIAAWIKAADTVVPIQGKPSVPSDVAAAGLGNPMPILAAILIWVVGIVAAAVVASAAISNVINALNSKAVTAKEILLKAEERKRETAAGMRAAGASQAEIDAALKSIDAETERAVKNVPSGAIGDFLVPTAIALGVGALAAKLLGVI